MNTLFDRLLEICRDRGMNPPRSRDIAAITGLSSGRVSQLKAEGATATIKAEVIQKLNALGYATEWILTGKGPKHVGDQPLDNNVSLGPDIRGLVPIVSWVQAGSWCCPDEIKTLSDVEEWLPCPVSHGPRTFVLKVQGQSMYPDYHEGEMIFVDPDRDYHHNSDVVIVDSDGAATFKRLQITNDGTYLIALNKNWPEQIIKIPDNSYICGTVIFSGRVR
ncbi:S24 family peptidase [Laribacter hongkongensis]|uniref:LexA family protein n=2 Tax=Laribacter hongkongensis TaxID=168471 RepID=UPI001EFD2F72|nr:S24 family peptidase [Laribacter hongkongensis]MCG9008036.1 S24 family peptidase [Laribacter hongkongensis]MCG9010692.1 S24 family peptidase [Laribacter hongkongensis]MCG9018008.1 S24 family peptidase [Laribacter hongkongensis]MCG9020640.1 S24 family peptidase [Laribacter hongkongensis]MCG9045466.1 S24 family peptidase [Laribacter hongkongensis]